MSQDWRNFWWGATWLIGLVVAMVVVGFSVAWLDRYLTFDHVHDHTHPAHEHPHEHEAHDHPHPLQAHDHEHTHVLTYLPERED